MHGTLGTWEAEHSASKIEDLSQPPTDFWAL